MVHVVEALTVQRHGFGRDEIAQIIESLSLAPEPRKKRTRQGQDAAPRAWLLAAYLLVGATTVPSPGRGAR